MRCASRASYTCRCRRRRGAAGLGVAAVREAVLLKGVGGVFPRTDPLIRRSAAETKPEEIRPAEMFRSER
jgi:hypothetical protein